MFLIHLHRTPGCEFTSRRKYSPTFRMDWLWGAYMIKLPVTVT